LFIFIFCFGLFFYQHLLIFFATLTPEGGYKNKSFWSCTNWCKTKPKGLVFMLLAALFFLLRKKIKLPKHKLVLKPKASFYPNPLPPSKGWGLGLVAGKKAGW
jgi:hypothetical protein